MLPTQIHFVLLYKQINVHFLRSIKCTFPEKYQMYIS